MHTRSRSIVAASLLAAATTVALAGGGRHDGTYLHEVRTVVPSPHTPWLKPAAFEKPSVLFMARRPGVLPRRVVELWQRMDLEATAYLFVPQERERDYWESNIAGSRTPEKRAEAIQKLSRLYDAIVLLGFDMNWLPNEAKFWLLRQVKGGCGLVAVDSRLPFKLKGDASAQAAIATGIPFSGLPGYASPEGLKRLGARAWPDVAARAVSVGSFGRGRVAAVRFASFGHEPEDDLYSDYHYALVVKALQWAVPKCAPAVRFAALPEGSRVPRGPHKPTLTLAADKAAKLTLLTTVRHPLLGVEASDERPLELEAGENAVPLALPALPAGTHFCDLRLRSERGFVSFGSFAFSVESPERIGALTLDPAFVPPGQRTARFRVALAAPLAEAATLRVTATDTYGREVARVEQALEAGAKGAAGAIPLDLVVALAQWVRAELRRGDAVLDARQALLIVRRPGPREYPALLWGGCEGGLDGLRQLRRQRETGFNICLTGVRPDGSTARFAALADMQMCIYATRIGGVSDGKAGKAANPDYMKQAVSGVVEKCRASAPYGVYIYSLGDECFTGGHRQPLGPADAAAYREFLKIRYRDLAELNRVWGTAHESFDAIAPIEWPKGAPEPRLFPQLHERAAFIEHLYAKAMADHATALKAMDPEARVGAEGSEPGDLELTLEGLQMWGPYSNRRIDVLLQSLAPPGLVRGMWWGGYHSGFFERSSVVRRFWQQVLEGVCNTNYFFDGHLGHHESNVASDLSWAAYFEKMIPDLRRVYETPGPLISAASPVDHGVAVHWSQASDHASLFHAPFGTAGAEANAAFARLDDLALNYRFVTSRQLEAKGLDPARVRLFVLPLSMAVSDAEAKALTDYCSRGGVVLATGPAGLMDGHCRLLERGQLDALLGLRRSGPLKLAPAKIAADGSLLGARLQAAGIELSADASVRAVAAETALAAGDVPVLTVRSVGKGRAVCLNAALAQLAGKGDAGKALARAIFGALLRQAGVQPPLRIEPPGAARAYTFALGDVTLVSFIPDPSAAQGAALRLAQPAHVYDCLAGRALGHQAAIERKAVDGAFGLYALSPKAAPKPELRVGKAARRGTVLKVEARLRGGKGRILRLDPHRPDGTWERTLRAFVTLDSDRARLVLPVAHNAPTGPWKLTLTDLATGQSDIASVAIE